MYHICTFSPVLYFVVYSGHVVRSLFSVLYSIVYNILTVRSFSPVLYVAVYSGHVVRSFFSVLYSIIYDICSFSPVLYVAVYIGHVVRSFFSVLYSIIYDIRSFCPVSVRRLTCYHKRSTEIFIDTINDRSSCYTNFRCQSASHLPVCIQNASLFRL